MIAYHSIRIVNNACGLFVFCWIGGEVQTFDIETLGL